MQSKGEQNYWQTSDTAAQPQVAPSQFAGPDLDDNSQPPQHEDERPLAWQASEYIHHEKGALWFVVLLVVVFALLALAFFVMHSWTFIILVLVMAAVIIVYARRPPRILNYVLSGHGIQIDERQYPYHEFRSFAVIKEGPMYSIMLIPVKRFMPAVNLYFPTENGEEIVDVLGTVLPLEERQLDFMDMLVRKLRF